MKLDQSAYPRCYAGRKATPLKCREPIFRNHGRHSHLFFAMSRNGARKSADSNSRRRWSADPGLPVDDKLAMVPIRVLLVSYGVQDCKAMVATLDANAVRRGLVRVPG